MRPERPHAAELRQDTPLLSPEARAELLGAALFVAAIFYLLPAARNWLEAQAEYTRVQTSALATCAIPAPGEQLLVVVGQREGRLQSRCLYVAGQDGARP